MFNISNTNNTNNTDNKDPNLIQGKQFIKMYSGLIDKVKSHLNLIGTTSSPHIGSIIESLENDNSTTNNSKVIASDVAKIDKEFNQLLVLYTKNYKLFMEELMDNNKYNDIISKYGGKNVIYNGVKYYINKYGFAQKYNNDDLWTNRSNSCSSNAINILPADFKKLMHSANMGAGQECGVAGFNIENKTTSEKAWIDIEGKKHVYSDTVWANRDSTCLEPAPKLLTNSLYNTIPEYREMSQTSQCNNLNVDPKILNNLSYLNNRLTTLAKKLLVDIEKLSTEDQHLKQELNQLKQNISNNITNLEKDKHSLNINSTENTIDLENKLEDSELYVTSSYTKYIIWLVTCLLLLALTYFTFLSSGSNTFQTMLVLGVIALLGLYIIFYELIPKFSNLRVSY